VSSPDKPSLLNISFLLMFMSMLWSKQQSSLGASSSLVTILKEFSQSHISSQLGASTDIIKEPLVFFSLHSSSFTIVS
jgi:hypothetical protein